MLQLKDVHTYYGPSHILHGIDLTVEKGDVVSVMGRNGAGKTTLMRTIMGLTSSRRGEIVFDGTSVVGMKPHKVFKLGIKLVPQGRRVFSKLTTEENLWLALVGQSISDPTAEFERVYKRFPILKDRRRQKVMGLSGGERQMLAIARAMLGETKILLMDEPTEGLAPLIVRDLRDAILEIKDVGITIVLAEQNVKIALAACDRHYILEKGEIRFSGDTEAIMANEEVMIQTLGVSG